MKFKNENDRFEWEVLELSEDDYIKKIILLKPFENYKDSFFEYLNAREKWNEAVKGKRFIRKIKKSLEILNNKDIHIVIAGSGNPKDIQIKSPTLLDNTHFIGVVKDMSELYPVADALIHQLLVILMAWLCSKLCLTNCLSL